jgi:hypothetical protein
MRRASAGHSGPEGAVDGQNALQTALYRYALAASPVLGSAWIWSAGAGVLVLRSKTLRRRLFLSGGRSRTLVPARVRPLIGWTSVRPSVEAPPLPSHDRGGPLTAVYPAHSRSCIGRLADGALADRRSPGTERSPPRALRCAHREALSKHDGRRVTARRRARRHREHRNPRRAVRRTGLTAQQ